MEMTMTSEDGFGFEIPETDVEKFRCPQKMGDYTADQKTAYT